jgi:D-serine deaminase-like pyridoxal phosphate-dependent protein
MALASLAPPPLSPPFVLFVLRDALAEAGLPPPVVTGAGTASYHEEARLGVHNEVQPGSFMLMDTDYGDNRKRADDEAPDFQHALWIHSSVMSTAMDERKVIIDAGSKAVDLVSGVPSFTDQADNWGMNGVRKDESVEFSSGGDEHGILTLKGGE